MWGIRVIKLIWKWGWGFKFHNIKKKKNVIIFIGLRIKDTFIKEEDFCF